MNSIPIAFVYFVVLLFRAYSILLLLRIVSSWIPELSRFSLMQWIAALTDPYLNIFRNLIPPIGMFDFSPILAFFALSFAEKLFLMFISQFIT